MDKIDIYLSFLRWCLSGKDASEAEAFIHDINWHELKKFAKKHNIVGLCWNGIQRGLKLQDIEVLDWMSSSIRIPKVNKRVFEQCVELTEYLKEKGFRSCFCGHCQFSKTVRHCCFDLLNSLFCHISPGKVGFSHKARIQCRNSDMTSLILKTLM